MAVTRFIALLGLALLCACRGSQQTEAAPPPETPLQFESVAEDSQSAITFARTVVIRDANAWAALWKEHTANRTPAPPLPTVDFSGQMVLGVFIGPRPSGCYSVNIEKAYRAGGKIIVEYKAWAPPPGTDTGCTAVVTYPSHLVTVARSEDPVEFIAIPDPQLQILSVDYDNNSAISSARTVVIRDTNAWVTLWMEAKANRMPPPPVPALDFSTYMVLGVFLGSRPNGCYSVHIESAYRMDAKIVVTYAESVPWPGAVCTQAITNASHLVAVPRSSEAVEFLKQQP